MPYLPIRVGSFDDFGGLGEQCGWDRDAKGLCCLEIYEQVEARWLLNRQITRFRALENFVYLACARAHYLKAVGAVRHKSTVSYVFREQVNRRPSVLQAEIGDLCRRSDSNRITKDIDCLCAPPGTSTSPSRCRHDGTFETLVAKVEDREGRPLSPEGREALRKAMLDPSDYSLTVPKGKALIGLSTVPEISKLFEAMSWTICVAASGFFITSDNPVALHWGPKSPHHLGFRNKTVEVMLPLSPKCMLMLTWRKKFRKVAALPAAAVKQVNKLVASHAERFVYAHLEHKHIAKLAREAFKVSRQMKIYGRVPRLAR